MSEKTATACSEAKIPTEHASKYLQQLCKHFAHKRPVVFDAQKGQISLLTGECHLTADSSHLIVSVAAEDDGQLPQLEDVVVRHLVRFAFREELPVEWKRLR
ncbi:MAG: DUF2218 domain-containing protein [Alphaproteobacteria bacterium]|nr:DUF2218 domain-containing protein [Alphaproteobacteria bacterium]MBU1552246.1 DUF2218 domain-containing protein [Alphaproteobacteria bacterium]MBU2336846.1 DUF2218 domain-containing protein [Alphaproteobacteria bacterium]MBU2389602.1 DUF2218 domain-containing protein [Alphaproteobacteria bacterium]